MCICLSDFCLSVHHTSVSAPHILNSWSDFENVYIHLNEMMCSAEQRFQSPCSKVVVIVLVSGMSKVPCVEFVSSLWIL